MDFRTATDLLGLPLADLARALGCSHAAVAQARMDPDRPGHRSPPPGWRPVVARLLRARGAAMLRAAEAVEQGG